MSKNDGYYIRENDGRCSKCGGQIWDIIGPDGKVFGSYYGDDGKAGDMVDLLNEAFKLENKLKK